MERGARRITPEDPDERYHLVRILAKRSRYAAEAIGPVLGKEGVHALRFATAAAQLQDLLGSQQDAVIGAELVRQCAESTHDPRFSLAAGRLLEREEMARAVARNGFPKAWRVLARRGERLGK